MRVKNKKINYKLAKKGANKNFSFGYVRAEIIGGLVNAVFLLSVTVFIVLDAISRYLDPHPISQPWMILGVAVGGIGINLFGMILFCVCFFIFFDSVIGTSPSRT